jgi:hypothetical protein
LVVPLSYYSSGGNSSKETLIPWPYASRKSPTCTYWNPEGN